MQDAPTQARGGPDFRAAPAKGGIALRAASAVVLALLAIATFEEQAPSIRPTNPSSRADVQQPQAAVGDDDARWSVRFYAFGA